MAEPTACTPHRIVLCWTPEQNSGQVSAGPDRTPVAEIVGMIRAGETTGNLADELGISQDHVRLLRRLANDLTGAPGRWYDGDFLRDVVLDCCPAWMADQAARDLADRVLAELAGAEGV